MIRSLMLGVTVLTALPALAQDAPREKAKAFFIEGRTRYAAGDFAEALEAFRQANALAPHPLMLFNIAQVFEAMDDLPAAIEQYQKYLATQPKDAAAVEGKIGALQATLDGWPAVAVETMPPGAAVRVGAAKNPSRGTTPMTLRLPPRAHTLFLSLAGHEGAQRPIQLQAGARSTLTVALVPIRPFLRVVTTPPGARVRIDGGEPAGPTPLARAADGGKRTVRVELEGFEPVERQVTLSPTHTRAAPYVLEIALEKAVPRGSLELSVSPAGSEVFVDGRAVGRAPLTAPLRLTAGLHEVEVRAPGADPYTEMVAIEADSTVRTEIEVGGGVDLGTVGIITMGVGGLAMAGGVVAGVLALGASGDLDDCRADAQCNATAEDAALADDVRSRAFLSDALLWPGLAVAAGGAVLYILSSDAPTEVEGQAEQAWFVAPLEGGAAAVGRFRF